MMLPARNAILTIEQMYAADAAAMAAGIPTIDLMENAGRAVADAVCLRWGVRPVAVLCGPGNNGGDGFVAARILARRGWPVSIFLLGDLDALKGDAAHHARLWHGPTAGLEPGCVRDCGLVIDAVFGAGLARPIEGALRDVLENLPEVPVVAVDVPSGVDGNAGQVRGYARAANVTVTFFRPKPGHLLSPAKALIGELVVADIGIPEAVLDKIQPPLFRNDPNLWRAARPVLRQDGHKFDRGHLSVVAGPTLTGAARLAARAAMHAGAGLVTILSPAERAAIYRSDLAAFMVAEIGDSDDVAAWLADPRRNAVVVGPGLGREDRARAVVRAVLEARKAMVLDADALSAFAGQADDLAALIQEPCVLTPHAGEFARLFGEPGPDGRLAAARAAAERMRSIIVLKGSDTVIAAPDGRVAINDGAPPWLAVAGSGDVLSGIIGAALAMGMPAFEAAALSVAVHATAGQGMLQNSADALAGVVAPLWQADEGRIIRSRAG